MTHVSLFDRVEAVSPHLEAEVRRPVMRYHGGKWRLAPWIVSHFPEHRVYVEPFGGAASVLLRKPRSYAEVYNDLDSEVVNVFRVLRDRPGEIERLLRLTPFARDEFDLSYEPAEDEVEQARRTILRAFLGHGTCSTAGWSTGFRAKSFAHGTPAAADWAHYPSHVASFASRLAGVVIEHRPALEVIEKHDSSETLYYVDPPYLWETRNPGTSATTKDAYRHELTSEQHVELLEALKRVQGMVVLSGYPAPVYDEVLGWEADTRAALADRAAPRTEVLWLSPNISGRQLLLFD